MRLTCKMSEERVVYFPENAVYKNIEQKGNKNSSLWGTEFKFLGGATRSFRNRTAILKLLSYPPQKVYLDVKINYLV